MGARSIYRTYLIFVGSVTPYIWKSSIAATNISITAFWCSIIKHIKNNRTIGTSEQCQQIRNWSYYIRRPRGRSGSGGDVGGGEGTEFALCAPNILIGIKDSVL